MCALKGTLCSERGIAAHSEQKAPAKRRGLLLRLVRLHDLVQPALEVTDSAGPSCDLTSLDRAVNPGCQTMIFEHDGHGKLLARFASRDRQGGIALALHGFTA